MSDESSAPKQENVESSRNSKGAEEQSRSRYLSFLEDRHIRNSLYTSIIAGILILLFIEPLLNLIWRFFLWAGPALWSGLVDRVFASAAMAIGQAHVFPSLVILVLVVVVTFVILLNTAILDQIDDHAFVSMALKNAQWKQDTEKIERILSDQEEFWKDIVRYRAPRPTIMASLFCFFIIITMASTAFEEAQRMYLASFNQRLQILTPLISDQDHDELLASWSSMQNRVDYQEIVEAMDSLATINDFKLPEPPY